LNNSKVLTHNALFNIICQKYAEINAKHSMKIEEAYFLIFSLNHLREWICPGYHYDSIPQSENESKFNKIYDYDSFKIINDLANHTKHLQTKTSVGIKTYPMIDDWPSLDDVSLLSVGYVSFYIEDKNLTEVFRDLILAYNDLFFSKDLSI
jgi:hypothetical protein